MKLAWCIKRIVLFPILLILLGSCRISAEKLEGMNHVKDVDLKRYTGTWYEIARFPHSFEKNLVGVTATYAFRNDGKIDVLNEGYKNSLDGKYKKAKAVAKLPDKSDTGHLRVFFFWPFGADYIILELDKENYAYALVGSSSDNYLWVLSRTPNLDEDIYRMLVRKAETRGYDIRKLQRVPQRQE